MRDHKYCPFENVICFIKCRHVNFIPKTLSLLVFIVYEEDILAKRKRLKETVRCASYK